MTTEGIYTLTATAQAADRNTYTDTIALAVINRAQLDALLKEKWEGMKAAMLAGNIEGAVGYFIEDSRNSYRKLFTALAPYLPQIVADMGELNLIEVMNRFAVSDLRVVLNGTTYSLQVLFIKDRTGKWMIGNY